MKRIVLGLLWAAIGCGEDGAARGGGVRVWRCSETRVRELVDVGFPPSRNGVEFVIERQGSCVGGWAVVTTANASETEGVVARVNLTTFSVQEVAPASPDATARYYDDRLYILNRSGADSIRVYDTRDNFSSVGPEFSVSDDDEPAEPHDICCTTREECYVTRREDPEVLIINPEAGGKVLGRIDLSTAENANPRPGACSLVGSRLAVALDNAIAFVDLAVDPPTVLSTLETIESNPSGRFVPISGTTTEALIAETGEPGVADGVLEQFDLATRESLGTKLTEDALGGDLTSLTHCTAPQSYWAIAVDASGHTALRSVDLATASDPGVARRPLFEADDDRLTSVSADECGRIWVTDRE